MLKKTIIVAGILLAVGCFVFANSNQSVLILEKKSEENIVTLKKDIKQLKSERNDTLQKLEETRAEFSKESGNLLKLKEEVKDNMSNLNGIKDQYNVAYSELTKAKTNTNNLENNFRKLSAEISQMEVKKNDLKKEIEELAQVKSEIDYSHRNNVFASDEKPLEQTKKEDLKVVKQPEKTPQTKVVYEIK